MNTQVDLLTCLAGGDGENLLYLPDLTLWYTYHRSRNTLPDKWQTVSLSDIARAMGVPIWCPVRPWRVETPGMTITTTEQAGERLVISETPAGTLRSRWVLGPDGEWWQTDYPVKSEADLAAALALVQARTYIIDSAGLEQKLAEVGQDGIVAIELPRRPYSDLLHEFLGWSEGLLFLGETVVEDMVAVLENKLQQLVQELAGLPGQVIFSPDNLDGQFISPAAFRQHLAGSYRLSADTLHRQHKLLLVHIGGPIKRLLAGIAEAGVDGVEGIAGAPQSDLSLAEARSLVGPGLALWGGIAQDVLLDTYDQASFEDAVARAASEASAGCRMIVGVADRVPVNANLSRLEAIPGLIQQILSGGK